MKNSCPESIGEFTPQTSMGVQNVYDIREGKWVGSGVIEDLGIISLVHHGISDEGQFVLPVEWREGNGYYDLRMLDPVNYIMSLERQPKSVINKLDQIIELRTYELLESLKKFSHTRVEEEIDRSLAQWIQGA